MRVGMKRWNRAAGKDVQGLFPTHFTSEQPTIFNWSPLRSNLRSSARCLVASTPPLGCEEWMVAIFDSLWMLIWDIFQKHKAASQHSATCPSEYNTLKYHTILFEFMISVAFSPGWMEEKKQGWRRSDCGEKTSHSSNQSTAVMLKMKNDQMIKFCWTEKLESATDYQCLDSANIRSNHLAGQWDTIETRVLVCSRPEQRQRGEKHPKVSRSSVTYLNHLCT